MRHSIEKRLKLLVQSAKKRGISVNLNSYYYKRLLEIGCIFCGQELFDQGGYCLDRHDNTKGYTEDNVSPCCKICNQAKGQLTHVEYFNWIKKSYRFQENKRKELKQDSNPKKKKTSKKIRNQMINSSAYRNATTIVMEGER